MDVDYNFYFHFCSSSPVPPRPLLVRRPRLAGTYFSSSVVSAYFSSGRNNAHVALQHGRCMQLQLQLHSYSVAMPQHVLQHSGRGAALHVYRKCRASWYVTASALQGL
jgi:hypothetical protein